jgi:invasion protein IalB
MHRRYRWSCLETIVLLVALPYGALASGPAVKPPTLGQLPPQPEQQSLIFSPWVKLCKADPGSDAKRVCVTVKDGRVQSGLLVVSVTIIESDGEQRKLLRMSMPYGVALQHGTRLIVDQEQPSTAPFTTCLPTNVPPAGCIADYEATSDLIDRLRNGRLLTVQAIHMNGTAISPQLELRDFAVAYDGPPADAKLFEEKMRQQQRMRTKDDTLAPKYQPWRN